MSSFDAAFNREQQNRQANQRAMVSAGSRDLATANAAVPHLTQMLRDFSKALDGRVRPQAVELPDEVVSRRFSSRSKVVKRQSPVGYPLLKSMGTVGVRSVLSRLSLVTPDGRWWSYSAGDDQGDYVALTGEAILDGRLVTSNGGRINVRDGEVVVESYNFGTESSRFESVADYLAARAHDLIARVR